MQNAPITGDSFVRVLLNVAPLQVRLGGRGVAAVPAPLRLLPWLWGAPPPCPCLLYPTTGVRRCCCTQANVSQMLLERLPEFCDAQGEEAPLPQLILGQFRWWVQGQGGWDKLPGMPTVLVV